MSLFNEVEVIREYENLLEERQKYLYNIELIVIDSKTPLEGNSFYIHTTLYPYSELYTKQVNLFWCGKQAATRICEIGFNAGHSAMVFFGFS